MDEPDSLKSDAKDEQGYSTLGRSASRRSTPGRSFSSRSTPGRSVSRKSPSGRSTPGPSTSGRSTPGRSTPDRSTTPEPPPVPPATYHWEEVRRKRSVGGYPWTHLNKPPFDEKTWVKYERDHVYEPVTPGTSAADKTSSPAKLRSIGPPKDDGHSGHFLRIPLTEELVMADETGSESEADERQRSEKEKEEEEQEGQEDDDDDDDDDENAEEKKPSSDESIYEGENENSSSGEPDAAAPTAAGDTRIRAFQQKVKVKAGVLRKKLQGVTKRKPKQKIVVDAPSGGNGCAEKSRRRRIGQFATLPKKFTFNAAKVNFSNTFRSSSARTGSAARADEAAADPDETKSGGRFSFPRFGFSKTSSESPGSRRSLKIGASRLSMPGFRPRTWSDASKTSKPDGQKSKLMDFGTYPRIFSKRRKTNAANKAKTPPPPPPPTDGAESPNPGNRSRKESFRRRFFRSHKESTPGPSDDRPQRKAALAVEEELDEAQVSKESLAEFGDSDLQEVTSLGDDRNGHRSKDTKSLSDHRPGVIEEIDSDEFFLREKGLSRGDVHISNYLSSEIRHVFRSNRTRSVESVNDGNNGNGNSNDDGGGSGVATPVRPSRSGSLRRPAVRSENAATITIADASPQHGAAAHRFSTMPKSFGGTRTSPSRGPEDGRRGVVETPENIITSRTFEPSRDGAALPSAFRVPWRTAGREPPSTLQVPHTPPKPPARQRTTTKFSTFDSRSMIDLSRKRNQSQFGFMPTMNLSETVPKAPLRRSRTSLAGSERDISMAEDTTRRPFWAAAVGGGAPTPPLRRSRMSLTTDADADERWKTVTAQRSEKDGGSDAATAGKSGAAPPPRPPPPSSAAGYATVDKSAAAAASPSPLQQPPQSPARHRRKKSYETIKSQEFGAFFTVPRSHRTPPAALQDEKPAANSPPPPSRPARAYNTLGPSRPHRRRAPAREHEYGDVSDDGGANDDARPSASARSPSLDDGTAVDGPAKAAALSSGDVIEKMKFRPLPSPPPPPRCKTRATDLGAAAEPHCGNRRRNTDSALVPFLDRRETSATLSDRDFFADVSRALLASAAANAVRGAEDEVSVGVQTDPLPDGYDELDDLESCCSAESDGPTSRAGSLLAAAERPDSRVSTATEYVDRPTSSVSTVPNGYAIVDADHGMRAVAGVIRAHRISVNELRVGKMTVADIHGQRMGVDDMSGSSLKVARLAAAAGAVMSPPPPSLRESAAIQQGCSDARPRQDDDASVQSSRVSSMYPEVDSDEDRSSVLAAPTPPRRRSKPPGASPARLSLQDDCAKDAVDLSAVAADPSITELSCQLFRLCHTNVCSLFNKVAHQVVPEDTEKRRDLQAALCFLSIILAGLLILGFGNEKTIHHHHWDFQFPPSNQ